MCIGNYHMGVKDMYETAKQLFLQGQSIRKTALQVGMDERTLSVMLKEDGLNTKPRGMTRGRSKYNHNFDAFKKIDTEEKAYWLGFLYADASVSRNRGALDVALAEKDREHLEKFRDFISPEMEVKTKYIKAKDKVYTACRLCVTSIEIVEDLIEKGCIEKKSLTVKFPTEEQVPSHLIHHFMRGYFDGDGCAYHIHDPRDNSRPQVNIEVIGSFEFMEEYQARLHPFGLPKREKYKMNGKAYGYRFGGNKLYQKFANFLYQDATIYLERKLFPEAHLKLG